MRTFLARLSARGATTAERPRRTRYAHPGASVGLPALALAALIRQIRSGLSFKALERLSEASGITVSEIAKLLEVPARTLARRKAAGRLTAHESERLMRLSGIFERAVDLFDGNVPEAVAWLAGPKRALGFQTPLECQRTEFGARQVEDLIGSLLHGVFV